MQQLRVEADASSTKVEELTAKVKTLEQENLAKEQEITSLTHKNQTLEAELEELHGRHGELKEEVNKMGGQGTHNEALQRRLQILEEEAEEADKNLRETNDKYAQCHRVVSLALTLPSNTDSARLMSKPATTNAKFKLWNPHGTSGRRSMRRCRRNTPKSRRNLRTSSLRLGTCRAGLPMSLYIVHEAGFPRTSPRAIGIERQLLSVQST